MRRRISWLVLATTSAVVMAFVIPLCLLVRTLARRPGDERGRPGRPQRAPWSLTGMPTTAQLDGYLADLNGSIVPQVAVLTPRGRASGPTDDPAGTPTYAGP